MADSPTWAEALIARARLEPIGCDIADYSDEFCAGFLAGQASVLEEVLAGRLQLPGAAERVHAFDLHKERIRRLQVALCECQHSDQFQADLHDETCPVYLVADAQVREYERRV